MHLADIKFRFYDPPPPLPPEGLHSLFKDREKIIQTLFFFSCNNIF